MPPQAETAAKRRAANGTARPRPAINAGSARSMLLTVLGELVYPNKEPVWTASLLYMLVGMGIEPQTARQAIARAAASDWIEAHKHGREVRWHLTARGTKLIEEGSVRVFSLHSQVRPWDGNWLALFVSISDAQRATRKKLYTALEWEGFGNPTPGVWVTPHTDHEAIAKRIADDLGVKDSILAFIGRASVIGQTEDTIVRQAWDLTEVTAKYEQLLIRYSGLRPAHGDPVLFTHVRLVNEWQHFPFMDPQLPEELVPHWIGRRAAAIFYQQRSAWYEDAQARWREVVAETSA
jgi:phenylacetic acid degradation operon negative regulatory protein